MSRAICIMGESGSGKTTAMRTLDPKTTYYIDCDGKGLSWKGWREQYNTTKKNYFVTDNQAEVAAIINGISEKRKEIKNVVIDTINAIMIADERRRMAEKNYDKWADLAWAVYDLTILASRCREDLNIIVLAHTQTEVDENTGERFTRILTNGKKLNKIGLEKYFTTVLMCKQTEDGFKFITSDMASTCKTPLGAFEQREIPNDMAAALKVLEEY